jgi:preprotein translocase subunit SecG
MTILFVILIILASVILGFIVLVQNPKGGGLAGTLGGFSNQLMGVKQTTDVLEKGTWIFAAVIAVLCLTSKFFIPSSTDTVTNSKGTETTVPAGQSAGQQPANSTPFQAAPDSQPK